MRKTLRQQMEEFLFHFNNEKLKGSPIERYSIALTGISCEKLLFYKEGGYYCIGNVGDRLPIARVLVKSKNKKAELIERVENYFDLRSKVCKKHLRALEKWEKDPTKFNRELFWEMRDYMEFLGGGLSVQQEGYKKPLKLFDSHGNLIIEYKDTIELHEYLYKVTKLKPGLSWKEAQRLNPITSYPLENGEIWVIGDRSKQ